jgi:hypothetical protein
VGKTAAGGLLLVRSHYQGYGPNVSSAGGLGQLASYDAGTYLVVRVWRRDVQLLGSALVALGPAGRNYGGPSPVKLTT